VCGYAFVVDPVADLASVYTEAYYRGEGADPLVDYLFELEHPNRTVRRYEWDGAVRLVESLAHHDAPLRWLDFGCGNGGLVRHARTTTDAVAVGFEEGWIVDKVRQEGIPLLARSEVEELESSFDVITAIEVLEHVEDPLTELRTMRRLLRPGGLLFCTTGNAEPHWDRLPSWPYVLPEIHIGFFTPRALERALEETGFRAEYRGLIPGYEDILKFKVLKNLRIRRRNVFTDALPAGPLARLADRRVRATSFPIGWAV